MVFHTSGEVAALPAAASQHDTAAKNYRYKVPFTIGGRSGFALLDSGNVWRCCISSEFATELGLTKADLKPMPGTRVSTAKEGAELTVLGEVRKPLKLQLGAVPTKFNFYPVVLDDLSMAVNISGPFMRRHNIDQLHSQNAIRVQSQLIPLATIAPQEERQREAPFSGAYIV